MIEEEELESLIGGLRKVPRAEAPPFLFTRIMAAVKRGSETRMPPYRLAWVAACALLIVMLNVFALAQTSPAKNSTTGEFSLSDNHFQLYTDTQP